MLKININQKSAPVPPPVLPPVLPPFPPPVSPPFAPPVSLNVHVEKAKVKETVSTYTVLCDSNGKSGGKKGSNGCQPDFSQSKSGKQQGNIATVTGVSTTGNVQYVHGYGNSKKQAKGSATVVTGSVPVENVEYVHVGNVVPAPSSAGTYTFRFPAKKGTKRK